MIVKVTLKDPDGVWDSLKGLSDETREAIEKTFFQFGEYCDIEINTDTMQAEIIKTRY